MQSNYDIEEAKLRRKLRKMRIIATSLLVFMTIVFLIFKRIEDRGMLYSSITAFAEASMVGALADWFAVVALFRYPLGLKIIPHTAIIANNKSRIAKALSNFVVSNFFTAEVIKAKLDKVSISGVISDYIIKNRVAIAGGIAKKIPAIVDTVIDNPTLNRYIKGKIQEKTEEIQLYPLLSAGLSPLVESGYHKPIVKGILNATYNYISDNKEKTMEVLGGINKTFALPLIGDIVYKKILEFFLKQIDEIDSNDEVEVNRLLLEALPKLLEDMQKSPELVQKGETLKEQIINSEVYDELVAKLAAVIIDFKNSIIANEAELNENLLKVLDFLVSGISENSILSDKIDNAINEGAQSLVSIYGDKVGSLIYDTMEGWETKAMVEKLEVYVGADLQYIRINGTIIGGLAGLAIHFLTILF